MAQRTTLFKIVVAMITAIAVILGLSTVYIDVDATYPTNSSMNQTDVDYFKDQVESILVTSNKTLDESIVIDEKDESLIETTFNTAFLFMDTLNTIISLPSILIATIARSETLMVTIPSWVLFIINSLIWIAFIFVITAAVWNRDEI